LPGAIPIADIIPKPREWSGDRAIALFFGFRRLLHGLAKSPMGIGPN
jgi:hypothetical protein